MLEHLLSVCKAVSAISIRRKKGGNRRKEDGRKKELEGRRRGERTGRKGKRKVESNKGGCSRKVRKKKRERAGR